MAGRYVELIDLIEKQINCSNVPKVTKTLASFANSSYLTSATNKTGEQKSTPLPCAIGGRNDGELDFQVGISTKELTGKHQCGDNRLAESGTPALSYSSSEHTHSGTGHCPSAEVARG